MATFLMIARHTPENCAMSNPTARKIYSNWLAKYQEISKKYGIKLIAGCSVLSEHLEVMIFDAPSLEAIQKANMEPEQLAVNTVATIELRLATSFEETVKMFQQLATPVQTR
jgi:hypothetical protein